MTGPWPDWRLLAIVAAAIAVTTAILAIGAVIGSTQRRRAGGQQAPGSGQAPVPGNAPPCGAASPPSRPSPAPGSQWHTTRCGCAIRHEPPDVLTCPAHAAQRADILDILTWAEELKDRL